MNKAEQRAEMKNRLNEITSNTYKQWSRKIFENLVTSDVWKNACVIAITIARGREVNTRPIIEHAWKHGKRVAVPKCHPKQREMEFRFIESFHDLEVVYYGIEEPIVDKTTYCPKTDIDLMVVPGIAFHSSGYRIGYGGGYYDRYLQDFSEKKISLAFHIQMIPHMTWEEHDIPVEAIVTDKGWIHCGN